MKTLVVYYSRKGYAESFALNAVKENDEADLLCIETTENTVGYDGFLNCLRMAFSKKGVTLFPYETDVASYEKVIFVAPIWCGALCAPIREFMKKERHHIQRAEYVFLHCLPGDISAAANEADKILRLRREQCTSVHCVFGHILKEEIHEN